MNDDGGVEGGRDGWAKGGWRVRMVGRRGWGGVAVRSEGKTLEKAIVGPAVGAILGREDLKISMTLLIVKV